MTSRRNRRAYLFISPFFLLFAVFGLYPIVYSFVLSLNHGTRPSPGSSSAFKNYANLLFNDPVFWTSLWNVVYIFLINVPAMILLSRDHCRGARTTPRESTRTFSASSTSCPTSRRCSPSPSSSSSSSTTRGAGEPAPGPCGLRPSTGSPRAKMSKISIDILVTWKWTGYNMIIALAGLQSIETQIYDAARIDGAGRMAHLLADHPPPAAAGDRVPVHHGHDRDLHHVHRAVLPHRRRPGLLVADPGLYLYRWRSSSSSSATGRPSRS